MFLRNCTNFILWQILSKYASHCALIDQKLKTKTDIKKKKKLNVFGLESVDQEK